MIRSPFSALTATTLFDLDAELDQIALQSPPNSGTLVATGKLGANASYVAGCDIYSQLSSGGTVGNFALAAFRSAASPSQTVVYSVNLLTGTATTRGSLSADNDVFDIAIPLNQF